MMSRILSWLGVSLDVVSREQAALDLLGRTYSLRWSPVIVTDPPEDGHSMVATGRPPPGSN